ncbi:MAG: zinc ribbon domain-containing protein [Deltaproteobacteria bacterium]
MDNVDRMFRHLVRTIRSRFPQYLSQPFDVSELHQTILPYRLNRRELALESNEDYEITITELLSGARDYMIVDDPMRDALRAELASVNPDPTAFKQFATARVAISPAALRSLAIGPGDDSSGSRAAGTPSATSAAERPSQPPPPRQAPPAPAAAQPPAAPAAATVAAPAPRSSRPSVPVQAIPATPRTSNPPVPAVGMRTVMPKPEDHCRSCGESLPSGRAITFCPHCGQNITTMNCPACGSELELGWKFCPACGRPASTQ